MIDPGDAHVHELNRAHVEHFFNLARREHGLAADARRYGFPDAAKVHEDNALKHQRRVELAQFLTAANGYIAALRLDWPGAAFAAREYMRDVRKHGYAVLAARIENEIQLSYNRVMAKAGHRP